MTDDTLAIGVDIGGSSAKIALVTSRGELDALETVPTADSSDPSDVLAPIDRAIDRVRALAVRGDRPVMAIGCGVPGNLDASGERVLYNNLPALDGLNLARWLQDKHKLPVVLDNDCCAAARAEVSRLNAVDGSFHRVLFVSVGSGIGAVLLVDGEVIRLVEGVTGDAGHIVVDRSSHERCPVGCRGCLETVASGTAIARSARRAIAMGRPTALAVDPQMHRSVTASDVASAARAGDQVAIEILNDAGTWLGVGLASMAPLYAPDLIILGGGVSGAGDVWLTSAAEALREHGMPHYSARISIRMAVLGPQAGVIGAGLMALR